MSIFFNQIQLSKDIWSWIDFECSVKHYYYSTYMFYHCKINEILIFTFHTLKLFTYLSDPSSLKKFQYSWSIFISTYISCLTSKVFFFCVNYLIYWIVFLSFSAHFQCKRIISTWLKVAAALLIFIHVQFVFWIEIMSQWIFWINNPIRMSMETRHKFDTKILFRCWMQSTFSKMWHVLTSNYKVITISCISWNVNITNFRRPRSKYGWRSFHINSVKIGNSNRVNESKRENIPIEKYACLRRCFGQ